MTNHIGDANKMVESSSPIAGKADEMPEWVAKGVRIARQQVCVKDDNTPDQCHCGNAAHRWLADDRERLQRERDAARNCLAFFASVIKSGESWTATCQQEYDKARASHPLPEGKL